MVIKKFLAVSAALLLASVSAGQTPTSGADNSPHRQARAMVNGVALHYLDWGGTGETILLLAGFGNDAHIFDTLAPKLTDRWRVIALTRRGFGESGKATKGGYTTEERVEDIRQLLEVLNLSRVHLVGSSLAGDEMTLFAVRHPRQTGKLVYLDAAHNHTGSVRLGIGDPGLSAEIRQLGLDALAGRKTASQSADTSGGSLSSDRRDVILAYLIEMTTFVPEFAAVRAPILALYAMSDRHPGVSSQTNAETRARMDAWWAEHMMKWQREQIANFRRAQPRAETVELDASHLLFMGDSQDDVVRRVRQFLVRN
jgi:pimeloyl-ACP methyl ester carboxylesterase